VTKWVEQLLVKKITFNEIKSKRERKKRQIQNGSCLTGGKRVDSGKWKLLGQNSVSRWMCGSYNQLLSG